MPRPRNKTGVNGVLLAPAFSTRGKAPQVLAGWDNIPVPRHHLAYYSRSSVDINAYVVADDNDNNK
jgi:hypothetical protein